MTSNRTTRKAPAGGATAAAAAEEVRSQVPRHLHTVGDGNHVAVPGFVQ
jgi:hypothetical protein